MIENVICLEAGEDLKNNSICIVERSTQKVISAKYLLDWYQNETVIVNNCAVVYEGDKIPQNDIWDIKAGTMCRCFKIKLNM